MKISEIKGVDKPIDNKRQAQAMRSLCSDKERVFEITGELWLEIADRLERQDRFDEIEMLKKELNSATKRAEGMDRHNFVLDEKCTEYRTLVDFQKGKIEAYEFALRCIGGKDGNS